MEKNKLDLAWIIKPNTKKVNSPNISARNKTHLHLDLDVRKRKLYMQYENIVNRIQLEQKIDQNQKKAQQRIKEHSRIQTKQENRFKISKNISKLTDGVNSSQLQEEQNKQNQKKFLSPPPLKRQSVETIYESYSNLPAKWKKQTQQSIYRLPKLKKVCTTTKQSNINLDIINLGLFEQHKTCQVFLKTLKNSINRAFSGSIQLTSQKDLNKLEYTILKCIHLQGKWLLSD